MNLNFKDSRGNLKLKAAAIFEDQQIILELNENASRENRSEALKKSLQTLFDIREKRIRPLRDEKILTSWNSLMISSLAKASQVLEEPRYEKAAIKAAEFILKNLQKEGNILSRRWMDGEAKHPACLEDYSYFCGCLN